MRKPLLTAGTVIVLLVVAVWAVWSDALRPVYLADIPYEPFRATEEHTFWSAFEPPETTTREILYDPPFSWSTRCDDRPYCSTVIVGGRAWNYVGGGAGWREVDLSLNLLGIAAFVFNRPVRAHQLDKEDGPPIAGEPTQRLRAYDRGYGDRVADAIASRGGSEQVRRTNDGATLAVEVLIGRKTGRLYEAVVTIFGPNMNDRTRLTFEYDVEVEISPPEPGATASSP